jgi:hypothetical protein
MMPKGVRPIPARAVASAVLEAIVDTKPGVHVLKSGAMQLDGGGRHALHWEIMNRLSMTS